MVRLAFEEARAANPYATLLINDFDLSEEYEALIAACLDAGIAIDAIGIQSHMHQGYWGEERTAAILERYARFGLPLHWTETTILSGQLMPPEIVDLNDYQVDDWPIDAGRGGAPGRRGGAPLPDAVRASLGGRDHLVGSGRWGMAQRAAGLLRKDGSPKPAFEALRALVKGEWWLAPTRLPVDAEGRVRLRVLPGTYVIEDRSGSASSRSVRGGSRRDSPSGRALGRTRASTPPTSSARPTTAAEMVAAERQPSSSARLASVAVQGTEIAVTTAYTNSWLDVMNVERLAAAAPNCATARTMRSCSASSLRRKPSTRATPTTGGRSSTPIVIGARAAWTGASALTSYARPSKNEPTSINGAAVRMNDRKRVRALTQTWPATGRRRVGSSSTSGRLATRDDRVAADTGDDGDEHDDAERGDGRDRPGERCERRDDHGRAGGTGSEHDQERGEELARAACPGPASP